MQVQGSSLLRGQRRNGKEPMGSEGGYSLSLDWEEGDDMNDEGDKHLLVGKLLASRAINVKAAIETMTKLWNPSKQLVRNVVDVKEKTFIFRFDAERDKARVLEGQPWHFDKFVWCFNEPNCEGKLTDVSLTHFPMWARIYDLPLSGRTNSANVKRIGDFLGFFISVEVGPNTELDRAIRVRYLLDVRQPLKASVPIKIKAGKSIDFIVKYERLPLYCYGCGVLGHGEKDCENGPYEDEALKFGEWLRASPWKIVKTSNEGVGM